MKMHTQLYNGQIEIQYQVTDYHVIKMPVFDSSIPYTAEYLKHTYFVWKDKLYLTSFVVAGRVDKKLKIHLWNPCGIHVHDGPGRLSDQVNQGFSYIYLSSFQAYILVYTNFMLKLNRRLDSSGIYWYSRNVKGLKLYANKNAFQ